MSEPTRIASRSNALLVKLRRLSRDGTAYRRHGRVWLEGDHLCAAAVARGITVEQAVVSESGWIQPALRSLSTHATRAVIVPDVLFADLSSLESPASIGCVIRLPAAPAVDPARQSVVLDRVQDAGNVGSILRSAAALGATQILSLKGTAALWSPKVLRAGMGAHFALHLIEGLSEDELLALGLPLVATTPHGARPLPGVELPASAAWLLGHEGQGVSARLLAACHTTVAIPQPGGGESLNVAAAAAICLYESARRCAQ